MKKPTEKAINKTLENLAKQLENIETLETRMSDHLDFYDMGVGNIKRLMRAAYEAGYKAGIEK
ncbi:DUF6900 domain-containing protein [Avibacterium paragallinarum]|uniref:DUF6900 domain-containing protein n=1 Tax=Avibacterium paragallinarum TaxID=728 RepID=A0ABU7QKK9_AVIPA|nr:hypothetical protein [Avibacterium paragallinarum]QZP15597.1 hypothetical protein K5O18_12805 [Avibacterium paragallinarum]QZP15729.1 hypothetical protein K5O18_13535 [Avibacterium paragallinarum]QZP16198.1 hypothetical protein K5O18_02220 [Avibacterium paragallinarum]WAL56301.1 hypothetical protein OY678_10045 [Avibacterium paragallinarum]WAM58863.1 hypothetical protein OW731_10025 [Avibacterium paragallinarum]